MQIGLNQGSEKPATYIDLIRNRLYAKEYRTSHPFLRKECQNKTTRKLIYLILLEQMKVHVEKKLPKFKEL